MKHLKRLSLATCIMLLVFGLSGMASASPINIITNGGFDNTIGTYNDVYNSGIMSLVPGSSALYGWSVLTSSIDWSSLWESSDGDGYSLDLSGRTPGSISQTFDTNVVFCCAMIISE